MLWACEPSKECNRQRLVSVKQRAQNLLCKKHHTDLQRSALKAQDNTITSACLTFEFAPASMRASTMPTCPHQAACMIGVAPATSLSFGLMPITSNCNNCLEHVNLKKNKLELEARGARDGHRVGLPWLPLRYYRPTEWHSAMPCS